MVARNDVVFSSSGTHVCLFSTSLFLGDQNSVSATYKCVQLILPHVE